MVRKVQEITAEETWPIRQIVMWPNKPLNFIKLNSDFEGRHFGLFLDETLVSVISLFTENSIAQFRKFATLQEYQGQGIGSQLLTEIMQVAEKERVLKIWCNARKEKTNYYAKFGLKETAITFSKEGFDYKVMEKIL